MLVQALVCKPKFFGRVHEFLDVEQIGLQMSEIEIDSASPLVGQTIGDMDGGAGGFVIVAVKRSDGTLARATDPHITIVSGDTIVILGHREVVPMLTRRAQATPSILYRGAAV